jgi:hypothetical protein
MEAYKEETRQTMKLVAVTGAVTEPMSIDETYLDLSGLRQEENADASLLQSRPPAQRLKPRIVAERQLTATIGITANKLLAKIASDHQKPNVLPTAGNQESGDKGVCMGWFSQWLSQPIKGARIARDRMRLASGSPANSALPRSNLRFRLNCSQMSAARQTLMDLHMTSGFATVRRRDRMQSRKSRTWFSGRCVRVV